MPDNLRLLQEILKQQSSSLLLHTAAAALQADGVSEAASGSIPKWLGVYNNLNTFQERPVLSSAEWFRWLNCLA